MAASTAWAQPSLCSLWVTSVRCTGFAKVSGKNDYAFIIETEWSDGRQFFVKRTFDEFQAFQGCVLKSFPELKKAERDKLGLRSGIKDLFVKDKRQLAESREPLVDAYLKNLISLPEKVAHSGLVLSFFESRSSDPKPCKLGALPANNQGVLPLDFPIPCHDSSVNSLGREKLDPSQQAQCQYEGKDAELSSNDDDDDYFLDVGLHELMLTNMPQPVDPLTTMCPESTWCSNIDKFSTLLRTNLKNLPLPRPAGKPVTISETSTEDTCEPTYFSHSDEECNGDVAESSDTESQLTDQIDYPDDKVEPGNELYSKGVAAAMGQETTRLYYLCSGDTV